MCIRDRENSTSTILNNVFLISLNKLLVSLKTLFCFALLSFFHLFKIRKFEFLHHIFKIGYFLLWFLWSNIWCRRWFSLWFCWACSRMRSLNSSVNCVLFWFYWFSHLKFTWWEVIWFEMGNCVCVNCWRLIRCVVRFKLWSVSISTWFIFWFDDVIFQLCCWNVVWMFCCYKRRVFTWYVDWIMRLPCLNLLSY